MNLFDLKTQALRYVALGELDRALLCYRAIVRHLPVDLDARMKIADVLVQGGMPQLAWRVYAAVAWCDLQAGRPLHALVCCQALSDLGQSVSSIHDSLAEIYGAGSTRLAHGEAPACESKLAVPDPLTDVGGVDLQALPQGMAAESAAEVAADTETFPAFPPSLGPVPLLSAFSGEAFTRISQAALIRRLGPRVQFIKEGEHAYSLFLVASGSVEIFKEGREGQGRAVLARLFEGAIVGELALLSPHPRIATVETCEPTDLLEIPVHALGAAVGDLPAAQEALERLGRERLLRSLMVHNPLFQPLPTAHRLELLRRFTCHHLPADAILVREGDVEEGLYVVQSGEVVAHRGEEPFEVVLSRLQAGDTHGTLSLLRGGPAPATLCTEQPATVLCLTREAYQRVYQATPAAQAILDDLTPEQLRELGRLSQSALPATAAPPHFFGPGADDVTGEFPVLV